MAGYRNFGSPAPDFQFDSSEKIPTVDEAERKIADYLDTNDLHQFCREWMKQTGSEGFLLEDVEAFRLVDRNLNLRVESKFDMCLKTRPAKNSLGAVKMSARALQISEVHRAVAACEYDNNRDDPSAELVQCLMNRVEFLLKHESKGLDYTAVLRDLDIVINFDVRNRGETTPRALYIKALCLAKLRRPEEAAECVQEAETVFGKLETVSSIDKVMFKNNINKVMGVIKRVYRQEYDDEEAVYLPFPDIVEACFPENPSFSDAVVVLTEGETEPRKKVVAARRISSGEVIGVEVAKCSSLNYAEPASSLSHCNNCLDFTKTPFPCPSCCDVVFCSFACLHVALDTYHPFECKMALAVLMKEWTNDPALRMALPAIRSVFQKPQAFFIAGGHGDSDRSDDGEDDDELLQKLAQRPYIYRYFQVLTVACVRLIRLSGYLDLSADRSAVEPAVFKFLFKQLVRMWFHAHSIVEPNVKCLKPGEDMELIQSGFGYFPDLRLINHGCAQNAVRLFKGYRQVVVAARNIEAGEEILINPLRNLNMPRSRRNSFLTNSLVKENCGCLACIENWPFQVDLKDGFKDKENMKSYLLIDLEELNSKGDPITIFHFVKCKSDLLEQGLEDRALYLIHGATNPEMQRCLHFLYGLTKVDSVC